MIKRQWTDAEINGRIYLQLCHLHIDQLFPQTKEAIFEDAFSVMHKLTATQYHLQNYKRIEDEQRTYWIEAFKKDLNRREESFELIFELEAFLYQIKSSLDMLVKILDPIIGPGKVGTHTYEKKGEAIVKGLCGVKQHMTEEEALPVHNLIELIQSEKQSWLETVIKLRDRISHVRGLRDYHFEPARSSEGAIVAVPPKFEGIITSNTMDIIYANNVQYHQDFMVFALALKTHGFIPVLSQPSIPEKHEYEKYVKWAWGFKNPPKPPTSSS
jgi:hypothetical protein